MTFSDTEEVLYDPRNVVPLAGLANGEDAKQIDLSLLDGGETKPAPLPLHLLGRWAEFVRDAAEAANAPVDYVAGVLLSGASAAIGNARWVEPWKGWCEPPVLWVCIVGEPSSGKSPSADLVLGALRRIEREELAGFEPQRLAHETACELAEAALASWKDAARDAAKKGNAPPPKPAAAVRPPDIPPPRIAMADTTPEALQAVLANNPRGVLTTRDELAGWLGSMDRYSGRGERPFWIEAYGGRPYRVDRKGGDSFTIPRLSVPLFGGMQPDKFAALVDGCADDGLTSRFLWIWPLPRPFARPSRVPDPAFLEKALRRLRGLPMFADAGGPCPRAVKFAPDAADILEEWRREHEKPRFHGGSLLKSWRGKGPGHVLRLALILEYLDWSIDDARHEPTTIGADAVMRAISLYDEYLEPMAHRVFGDAALPQVERDAAAIARTIVATRPASINLREDIYRARVGGIKDADRAQRAVDVLVGSGWLVPTPVREGPTKGRSQNLFAINPAIWLVIDGSTREHGQ